MKYLHVTVHDAARAGDYDPAMRRAYAQQEIELRKMTTEQLVASGSGWVTDKPLSRDLIVNTYNTYHSDEITDEQATQHEKARAALGID